MRIVGFIIIISIILAYEKIWRPKVCEKKICAYIEGIQGSIRSIEKLTIRDEIYKVCYRIKGETAVGIVKFNFFYDMEWK